MRTVSVIYLFMQRSPQTFLLKSFTRYSFGAILFILQEQPKEPPKEPQEPRNPRNLRNPRNPRKLLSGRAFMKFRFILPFHFPILNFAFMPLIYLSIHIGV